MARFPVSVCKSVQKYAIYTQKDRRMKLIPLPSGKYINVEQLQFVEPDAVTAALLLDDTDAAVLLAALNAPVQTKSFIGINELIADAVQEASKGANKFLAKLQPWQVVAIESQTVIKANGYGSTYNYIIRVAYRSLS
jgi:K+/H+ antiporter YhaU regulatory subunit KhtT